MDIFHNLIFVPVFNLLVVLYRTGGENLGLALIGIAFLSRLITIPITNKQIQAQEKNKEFQKKYNALKKKWGKNKEKLNQELAKLQAEFLPGQLSGCLPLIIQLVMFIQIFNVLRDLFDRGAVAFNEIAYSFIPKFPDGYVINDKFFGLELAKAPSAIDISNIGAFLPYAILLLLVVVSQYYSAKMFNPQGEETKKEENDKEKKKKKDKNAKEEPDMSEAMQMTSKQMQYIFPFLIGIFSFNAAAGLGVYWTVQSAFVIIQGLIRQKDKYLSRFFKKSQTDDNGPIKKN